MDNNIRQTAIDVMRQGGTDVCTSARSKWYQGIYGNDPKQQRDMVAHWQEVDNAVAKLAAELRKQAAA